MLYENEKIFLSRTAFDTKKNASKSLKKTSKANKKKNKACRKVKDPKVNCGVWLYVLVLYRILSCTCSRYSTIGCVV